MLNENVVKLLKSGMWDLATCANGEPNVVPVAFKDVTPDGKLVVGDAIRSKACAVCHRGRSRQDILGFGGDYVLGCCYRQGCAHHHAGESHRYHTRRRQ